MEETAAGVTVSALLAATFVVVYLVSIGETGMLVVPALVMVAIGLALRRVAVLRHFGAGWAVGSIIGVAASGAFLFVLAHALLPD